MGGSIDIVATKERIKEVALSVLQEQDIADVVLLERNTKKGIDVEYTFALKVLHDDVLSQKVFKAYLKNYAKTANLHPFKTQVIVENGTVKELFFLKANK